MRLEEQIESILGRTVGLGRVVAKVSAELDWTQTEKTEEIFDPDGQVARSTQIDSESMHRRDRPEGGVAGIVANSPDAAGAAGCRAAAAEAGRFGSANRSSETTNFEISKTINRHVMPTGQIKKLSIAVLLDGKPASLVPASARGRGDRRRRMRARGAVLHALERRRTPGVRGARQARRGLRRRVGVTRSA